MCQPCFYVVILTLDTAKTYLIITEGLGLKSRHMHLLVAFSLFAEGPVGQLAALVGHKVAALREGQIFQV